MRTKLIQLEERVRELELKAIEIESSASLFYDGNSLIQPSLHSRCHAWLLGAQGLLEKLYPEKLELFEHLYTGNEGVWRFIRTMERDSPNAITFSKNYTMFKSSFSEARGILIGSLERLKSREFDVVLQLSSALVLDEFETARQLFETAKGDESMLRAAGAVARVALERHLLTIADVRNIKIEVNPPSKKKAEAQDVLNSLAKANAITAVQKSELESLFKIGNCCAHPQESIRSTDVDRLIQRGKELLATIA
jgi:exonuclease VII small subunit